MGYTDQAGYSPSWEMFVKGLDSSTLSTSGTEMTMGLNNRAFVVTEDTYNNEVYSTYDHDLLGGSFTFTADMSEVDCACAAGVFGANLDDETCSWNTMPEGDNPQCASIDIMMANKFGFMTASNPCAFGSCDATSQC